MTMQLNTMIGKLRELVDSGVEDLYEELGESLTWLVANRELLDQHLSE